MRRLAPFLLAVMMASLPPSLLLLFIGGIASSPLACTHQGACFGFGGDVDVVSGFGSPTPSSSGSGFVTASVYASPSHYATSSAPTVAASIVSTMAYTSGGKQLIPPASAEPASSSSGRGGGVGTPRQLQPMQQTKQGLTLQQIADNHAANVAASPGVGTVGEAPPDTLKVSVLGASKGKSLDCTYSLVEFSNTHHLDTIVVHSTYIEPMAVFPPKWVSSNIDPSTSPSYAEPPLPSSFHGEYYEDRQLHIPPRTAVTIPVSIIPHWRKLPDNLETGNRHHYHYRKLDAHGEDDDIVASEIGKGANSRTFKSWARRWKRTESYIPSNNSPTSTTNQGDDLPFLATRGGLLNETAQNYAVHADMLDMILKSRSHQTPTASTEQETSFLSPSEHRASLLDAAIIHETLVANTSWGFVQMKVPYVCSPSHSLEYEFGLPNNLLFLDGGGGWYARRNTTPTVELAYLFGDWEFNPTRDNLDPFVYRLYMNNPTGKTLSIWEVFTTKPHLVGAKMQLHFDQSTAHPRMNDASYYYPLQSQPSSPENKSNIWVVTVRLFPDQFTHNMTLGMQDLGFLELRTNLGDFSIALDFLPNGGRGGVIHGIGENRTTLEDVRLVRDHVASTLLSAVASSPKPPATVIKSYRAPDLQEGDAEARAAHRELQREHAANDAAARRMSSHDSFLRVVPDHIDFGSITTGSRMIRIPLKLVNLINVPLRIMRMSVVMSTVSDDGAGNVTDISMESHRMEIGVDLSDGLIIPLEPLEPSEGDSGNNDSRTTESFVLPHDIELPTTTDYEYIIHVWCRFNAAASSSSTVTPRFYTGSILIQATEDAFVRYSEWERTLLLDHETWGQSPLTIEVPFEGSVLPGNLGSPTESLLFPTHFFVLPVEERVKTMQRTNGKIPEYYDRELDITNNFAVPISIVNMRILDSLGDDDYCNKRFSIPMFNNNKVGLEGGMFKFPTAEQGKKWKGLSVRYHYQTDMGDYDDGGIAVRKCILSLETDRAGKQSLPLIIYSGEVTVDIVRPEGGQLTVHCLVTKKDGETVVSKSGMPCMEDWMGSTIEGTVLHEAILKMGAAPKTKGSSRKSTSSRKSSSKSREVRMCAMADPSVDRITSYFQSLLSGSAYNFANWGGEVPNHALQPVVLSFGAIATGKSAERSILLTNMNHAPIEIGATTASLGNMDVRMAVIPSGIQDMFRGLKGRQPENDAAYFLNHSPVAQDFFTKFQHRFDIVTSSRAVGTELISLFHRHAVADTFSNVTEYVAQNYVGDERKEMDCSCGFMLATDGTYHKELTQKIVGKKKWILPPGGVARFVVTVKAPSKEELTNDVTPFVGTGLVLETSHGQALPIVLTYSAIAGQLQLKPSSGDYNSSDFTETKDVVVGAEFQGRDKALTVHVPLTLKDPTIPSVDSFAQRNGVALSIESSFAQDIYLSEIRSCNKWFNVFLPSNNAAARAFFNNKEESNFLRIKGTDDSIETMDQGSKEEKMAPTIVPLGKVLSALSCSHPSGDTSFYACALAWLENRDQIQPPGCGLAEEDVAKNFDDLNLAASSESENERTREAQMADAKTLAISALRDVVAFLSVRYVDQDGVKTSGVESGGGYIHFSRIHMFEHAQNMWNDAVKLGLNTITGHIDAKTVFFADPNSKTSGGIEPSTEQWISSNTFSNESSDGSPHPPLSIPVSSVLLHSALEMPKLFDGNGGDGDNSLSPTSIGVVDFDTVHIADTSTRYIPISNPTAMSIRVRLAAIDSIDGSFVEDKLSHKNVFVQKTPDDRHSWWTGGSYWMSDDDGQLISASHNVTIKSGAGAYVSLLNPALHTMSAFVLGCGRRCGLRNDQESNGEEKNYSPIGAASGGSSTLLGRSRESDKASTASTHDNKSSQKALGINDPPSFSLGRVANEIVVPPYGTAELGPVYFRPPGRKTYEGTVYIENSLTGFEEVQVRGRGGWEHLVFLDAKGPDGGVDPSGGDVEFRFGQSALVFPGGSENAETQGRGQTGPVVKSARLANRGDVPIKISGIRMASSEIMHFTHKRRHPSTSSRLDNGSRDHSKRKCSARGFVLPGCVDPFSNIWIERIFLWCESVVDYVFEKIFPSSKPSEQAQAQASKYAEEAEKFYKNGFTMQPNQTQSIFVFHYPDCSFQTSYASVIFDIEDRASEAHIGRNKVGSWQQTFRRQKVELLVGYDMTASEFRNCVPYSPPETSQTSIWERKIEFQIPTFLQDVLSFGLTRVTDSNGKPYVPRRPMQATLLAASFLLLLFALSLDLLFTVEISACRKTCPSWKPTCRCLARADPTSSDLVSIGKEQTKHVLLSRFKKEGVLPSHCVNPDGSFGREKASSLSAGSGTHSEAIFDRLNLVNESKMDKDDNGNDDARLSGILPCGLSWRTALRRGVGISSTPKTSDTSQSPEMQYLTRTRQRYLKKLQEQRLAAKKIANNNAAATRIAPPTIAPAASRAPDPPVPVPRAPAPTPFKTTRAAATPTTTLNGNFTVATKSNKKAAVVVLPQDRKVEFQIKKKIPTTPSNGKSNMPACKPQLQSKLSTTVSDINSFPKKGSSNAKPPISERAGKNSSVDRAKIAETGKVKQQQKVGVTAVSNTLQTDQKNIVTDTKIKQKQRMEAKQAKNERANRTETKKDTLKQDDSTPRPSKTAASQWQKARLKPAAGNIPPGLIAREKQEEKLLQENTTTTASPSYKESSVPQTKPARQTKKSTNGTKNTDQTKGKQGKQKSASKKATSKKPPKSTEPTKKCTLKEQPKLNVEYPPLSSNQIPSPTLNKMSNHAHPKVANVRPPPGLLAPPGFLDQPDLEDLSTPSSPASSPQRLSFSSHNSRSPNPSPSNSHHTMPDIISGIIPVMEIIPSPPPDNDLLLSLIGSNDNLSKQTVLESSPLFQAHHNDHSSPRMGKDSTLSLPPAFRPQSFTPPILEPSPTVIDTSNKGSESPDVQALFGAGSNFNVTNFLDGILSESTQPPIIHEVVQQKPVEVAKSVPFQAKATIGGSVSLDPWNSNNPLLSPDTSNNNDPLAVLQGTVINNHQESSIIAGIPLNSNAPSLLSSSTSSNLQSKASSSNTITYAEPAYASVIVSDQGGGDDDDFLEPDSFYNQLLGED